MRYLIFLIIVVFTTSFCKESNYHENKKVSYFEKEKIILPNGIVIEEFQYDGCQYLHINVYKWAALTHKGSCKNPIHYCPYKIEDR